MTRLRERLNHRAGDVLVGEETHVRRRSDRPARRSRRRGRRPSTR
jgi:hypothetical protein